MVTDSGDDSTSVDDNTTVTSDSECASVSESISSSVNTVNTPVHNDNEVELHHLLKLAQSSSVNTVNQCFTSNVNTCSQSGITVTAHHLKAVDCMGSSLRPSSSHGLPVVWAVQTRSKSTASQSPTFSHNEGASSSSSKPQHIHFDDSDSDTEEHNKRSSPRLNIGGNSRRPEEPWHTVTKKRHRRQSTQNVKIPCVQLHATTGPHSKNIHILRAAAEMPGRKGNVLDSTGKSLSSKKLQSSDLGIDRCTVCILVRGKRQPIRKTGRMDRNTSSATTAKGTGHSAHYLSKCTQCSAPLSLVHENRWSPLLQSISSQEARIRGMVDQLVTDEDPAITQSETEKFAHKSLSAIWSTDWTRLQDITCHRYFW